MIFLPIAKKLPLDVGMLHFVGIGGIGMSGIAEVLHTLGYQVRGSDLVESYNLDRLRKAGIDVVTGHAPENVRGAAVVVISSAVKETNPELIAARAAAIPVVRRAEMLAEIMRLHLSISVAGTHGKTTTTSMLACMLDAAGMDPTVINGGIINAYGTNARLGTGEWLVAEADESDGTFTKLPSTVAVVTNIDPEHLDHYGSFDGVRAAFRQFIENLPFYGFAVACMDHPEVQALIAQVPDRRIVTYGTSPQADVRGVNIVADATGATFDVEIGARVKGGARRIKGVRLPTPGMHNVRNSLAAIGVALSLGIPDEVVRNAFEGFEGVKRRFTKTGETGGITVIDDYGHHPVEIAATLSAARSAADAGQGRVIAIVQPHRYTRLRDLFEQFSTCFNDADAVIVADVYAAGEQPIEGVSRDALAASLREHGHRNVYALEGPEMLAQTVTGIARPGDFVVCLGAGSVTYWAQKLPAELAALASESRRAAG